MITITFDPGVYQIKGTVNLSKLARMLGASSVRLMGARNLVKRSARAVKHQRHELERIDLAQQKLPATSTFVVPGSRSSKKRPVRVVGRLANKRARVRRRLRND